MKQLGFRAYEVAFEEGLFLSPALALPFAFFCWAHDLRSAL